MRVDIRSALREVALSARCISMRCGNGKNAVKRWLALYECGMLLLVAVQSSALSYELSTHLMRQHHACD